MTNPHHQHDSPTFGEWIRSQPPVPWSDDRDALRLEADIHATRRRLYHDMQTLVDEAHTTGATPEIREQLRTILRLLQEYR